VPTLVPKSIPLCPFPLYAPDLEKEVSPKYWVIVTFESGHKNGDEPEVGNFDLSKMYFI